MNSNMRVNGKHLIIPCLIMTGGGCGALCRFLMDAYLQQAGILSYLSILTINVTGAFLAGFIFFRLETTLRRDSKTRIPPICLNNRKNLSPGVHKEDLTLLAATHFKANQHCQWLAALLITGFLGGFTTFSGYALFNLKLAEMTLFGPDTGQWLIDHAFLLNLAATPILAILGCAAGFLLASCLPLKKTAQ